VILVEKRGTIMNLKPETSKPPDLPGLSAMGE
jgi:hypothetical protein